MPRDNEISADPQTLREDFHRLYGAGSDFEGATLIEVVVRAGDLLAETVGPDAVTTGFAALTRALGYEVNHDADWAEALRDQAFGDAYCWAMGERLHNLNAYAYYGIALNGGRTAEEREALLREEIKAVAAFMAKVPFAAWGIDPGDAGRTLRRAEGRFALDTGAGVDPATLALLGGLSERRIRNMMAGKERRFDVDGEGKILANEALSWLAHRPKEFRPSRWRDQNTFEDLAEPAAEIEVPAFVPIASDNSVFHPGLVREGTYTVGRGARESRYETYEAALAALQKLADPAWPRPTPNGTWTTVTAARWARMSRADLDRLTLNT